MAKRESPEQGFFAVCRAQCVRLINKLERNDSTSTYYPRAGDLVTFDRGAFDHWAVYIGNGKLVHLANQEELGRLRLLGTMKDSVRNGTLFPGVCTAQLDDVQDESAMSCGNGAHKRLGQPYPRQAIIERALLMVGQQGYHLDKNNCEHFATWARYGVSFSQQSASSFESLPVTCGCAERREDIDQHTRFHKQKEKTERLSLVGVLSDKAALKRFHFMKRFSNVSGAVVDEQWEMCDTEIDKKVRKLLSDNADNLHLGILGSCVEYWMISSRKASHALPKSLRRSWTVSTWDCGNPKKTLEDFRRFADNLRNTSEGTIRQLATRGSSLFAVIGPKEKDERIDISVASSFQELCRFVYRCWEDDSPSYVYLCTFFHGYWLIVASNKTDLCDQKLLKHRTFPYDDRIKDLLSDGWKVSCIAGGSKWVVFLDKSEHSQSCQDIIFVQRPGDEFPKREVNALMEKDERLVLSVITGN